jgi:transposase
MKELSIIGLDLAKQVFQAHGADERGRCVLRKQLKRREVVAFFAQLEPCMVAMEACGTAHYWAREIAKLGHEARLIPPAYVKAFVKRGKSDRIDAEAICEAASRPSMRFVAVKSQEQQAVATLHRARDLLIKSRTMQVNALRAHLAEFGFVAAKGIGKLPDLIKIVSEAASERLPDIVRKTLFGLLDAIALLNAQVAAIEKRLVAWHKTSAHSKRLKIVPGIGLMIATALSAMVPDAKAFKNGRHFAAWIGIVPKLDGTGGKIRLGRISKAGNRYLRRLFVLGATSLLRSLKNKTTPLALWVQGLLARRPKRAVTVALANKLARIASSRLACLTLSLAGIGWPIPAAMMAKGESFKPLAAAHLPAQAGCA